jgi:diguanylate cyclase (GGDEF)-like protein
MNNRSIRFLKTEHGKLAILASCIAFPLVGGMFLCQSLLMHMLREDAQATSSQWVSMLVRRNPDILTLFSDAAPSVQTKRFLNEASQVGDIYRFRIWDTTGNPIFKSERIPSAGVPVDISAKSIAKALASGSIINEVHTGSHPQNVPFFVESFIPVKRNGAVIGLFDVYLDQSDDRILYRKYLLLTETIIGILVLIAGGIPGIGVYRHMLKLRDARADAQFQSEHDSLTGLPNRNRLQELARTALALSQRSRKPLAALMIDMDRFKDINDTLGHATGDKVLKAVAKRLKSSIREGDSVGRFGGDEFVVLQAGMYQPAGARFLADRLIALLSEPYEINGTKLVCGASIGVAILPPDAEDFDALMACADAALHKAKAEGRSSLSFFEPGMDERIRQRRQIETGIRQALATNAFQLAYQPLYSFRDGGLIGFEALLRWPEGWPQQSPADFIPVAEESGLINRLGAWALETACRTAAGWSNPVQIAVNLSPTQFRQGNIVSTVEEALRKSGLRPERLELEVTENLWIQNTDTVLTQLRRLRKMGVSIALDDFGTGYSSLSYLWKFPFDTVKIDRSFVSQMETEPKAAAIVQSIMALGKTLDLTITAEGVETQAQAKILREAGCDQVQGYLFGRPLSVESANALANADPESCRLEQDTRFWLAAS